MARCDANRSIGRSAGARRQGCLAGISEAVSIHAPAKGATMSRCSGRSARCGFDPRSREGSDQCRRVPRTWIASFDPRSREGSDRPLINAFSISRNRPGSANLQPCRLGPMAAACHPPPFVLIFNGLSQARTSREFLACLGFAPEAARRWAGCRGAPRCRIDTVLHASTMSGRSSFREAELAPFESRIGALKRAATWAAAQAASTARVLVALLLSGSPMREVIHHHSLSDYAA